jgi:linoleoyl-CoA desaturase
VPFLNFAVTGLLENFFLRTQGPQERREAAKEPFRESAKVTLKKYGQYAFKNYVVYPALAGPMFWKVMLGNFAAATLRDIATSACFLPNHVGPDNPTYPPGTRPMNRGHWYAMQIEATNNFKVSRLVSIFAGATDKHIEHHLFPTFPTDRLRQIAPEVRAICEKYGVSYKELGWGTTLKRMFQRLKQLAKQPEAEAAKEPAAAAATAAA